MSNDDAVPSRGINTRLTHTGHDPMDYHGFVNPPVFRGSTVLFANAAELIAYDKKYTYGTTGTPTSDALGTAINALEGSAGTVVVPSGLCAVTLPLLAFASAGDHVLITDAVYFPTRRFADQMLVRMGIEVEYYDPLIGAGIESLMRPNTSVVFTESPASNTFEIQDIPAIAAVAHRHGAVVMMDNTWATPLFFKPLDHGVDISIHATTKYPGGHADLLGGTVSATSACWPRLFEAYKQLGVCAGPDDTNMVLRGLRSMGVRLERHQASALAIAEALQGRDGIVEVLHPALPNCPGHAIWKRDFCGSSGLFTIVLAGGREQAMAFLDALEIFGLGASWGGYESLAMYVKLNDRTLARRDHGGSLIRLHVGLEDPVDLLADLDKGLRAAAAV
jgi:cystathionine beta-lyase